MPKVQQYESSQVDERALSTPLQNFDTRGAFGEGVAQGALQLAGSLERIQDEDDKAVTKERVEQYRQFSREKLYRGDNAFFTRQGRSAYDSLGEASQELEKQRKELAKELTPRQARMYEALSNQYYQRDVDGMTSHAQEGRMTWLNDQDSAIVTSGQEDAALYWNDNDSYIRQVKRAVQNIATRNGWAPEKRDLQIEKAVTVAHLGAIDNILRDNPAGARAYFIDHRDEISASLYDDIDAKIDKADNLWKAQDVADTIRAEGGTRGERLAKVNEIDDPVVRNLVRSQVEHEFAQEETAEKEAQIDLYSDIMKGIIEGVPATQFAKSNPKQWDLLTGDQQARLLRGVSDTQSVPDVYFAIRGLADSDKPAALKMLNKNIGNLSWGDAKALREKIEKQPPQVDPNVIKDKAAFDEMIPRLIGKKPPAKASSERHREYQKRENILLGIYQDGIDEWHEANPDKKYIPHDDRQKLLDDMEMEFTKKKTLFGIDFLWRDKTFTIDDVPADDMEKIREALQDQDMPITVENIVKLYASQQ